MTARNELTKQIMIMTYKLSVSSQIKEVQKLLKEFKKEKEVKDFVKAKLSNDEINAQT